MDQEAPGSPFSVSPVHGAECPSKRSRGIHLDPVAVAHALEDRAANEDRFERALIGEPAVDEIDCAQLRDRVVRVPDAYPAREAFGKVAQDEHEGERVGLVAGDADEPCRRELDRPPVFVPLLGERLLEKQLHGKV